MIKSIIITSLIIHSLSIPFTQQRALANSLQVGRKPNPPIWDCADCYQDNKPIRSHKVLSKVHDIVSIVSVYEEFTVLAFRYTATLKNVWQDLLWAFQIKDQHTCHKCKVQRQYHRMWEAIKDTVLSDLSQTPAQKLVISGISLGGGLACISYVDISHSGIFKQVEVITFGAPRVGNKHWAKWFDQNTTSKRYFIRRDPIAYLPICFTPICNYRQTGQVFKCYPKKQRCVAKSKSSPQFEMDDFEFGDFSTDMLEIAANIDFMEDEQVSGLYDHIFGYKKIYNYTLVSQ